MAALLYEHMPYDHLREERRQRIVDTTCELCGETTTTRQRQAGRAWRARHALCYWHNLMEGMKE